MSRAGDRSIYPSGFARHHRSISVRGHRIAYFDSRGGGGSGGGTRDLAPGEVTLLMVHGNLTSGFVYHRLIEALPASFRCVAPDLLGFGLSDKPTSVDAYSLDVHVGILRELVATLELEDVVLVGHDWGGPIGLGAALAARERYRGLVFLNTLTAVPMRLPASYRMALAAVVSSAPISELVIRRLGLFQRLGLARSLDPESRRIYAAANHDAASRAGIAAFPRMIPTSARRPSFAKLGDLFDRLGAWEIPTLVLFSDADVIFPPEGGRELAERTPRGTFELVRGARHFVQHEAAAEVAERIAGFCSGLAA